MSTPSHFRRATIAVTGLLILTTALTGAAGCGRPDAGRPTTVTQPPAAGAATAVFGGTDLAWVELTIAMDEQVRPLLALVPGRSRDSRVRALAGRVQGFTDPELTRLRALHDEARLPAENPHEGMPMPGMVSADTVRKASTLSGTAFDKLVREQLTGHLRQGRYLAESEEKAGIEPRVRALASSVINTRTDALGSIGE